MTELIFKVDDNLASRFSSVAKERYNGDKNAALSDAFLLLFLQPIRSDRRRLAGLIDEIRAQVRVAGGITEEEIENQIAEFRRKKRAGQ
jgi:hypothetical protein